MSCGKLGRYVCSTCEVGMWEEEQICPSCRRNSRYGLRHSYCKGPLNGLTCLWAYEGLTKKLISKAKYYHLYDYLGQLITDFEDRVEFEYIKRILDDKTAFAYSYGEARPVVVPVPLHPKRLAERGFNQAEIIAKLISESVNQLEVRNLLIRTKDTGRQVGRTREERLESMVNAFVTSPQPLSTILERGQNVLLVDDVWTTGATMSECARVLKKAGVKNVWGLVLAR